MSILLYKDWVSRQPPMHHACILTGWAISFSNCFFCISRTGSLPFLLFSEGSYSSSFSSTCSDFLLITHLHAPKKQTIELTWDERECTHYIYISNRRALYVTWPLDTCMLAMMERVAVYVGGTAALCAAVYVLFGPDRLWKRQGTYVLVCGVCNSRILL